jgi:hypothetical protein
LFAPIEEYFPALQLLQPPAPERLYFPATQEVQAIWLFCILYFPAAQAVQAVAARALLAYLPGVHMRHPALPAALAHPFTQLTQSHCDVLVWNLPAGQMVQPLLLAGV